MKVIKRDQSIVDFDKNKIRSAICKAMRRGSGEIDSKVSNGISDDIYDYFHENNITPRICDIEQMVYDKLIEYGCQLTAKYYEGYRAVQAYKRQNNTTDKSIMGLLDESNREVLDENSNKNGRLISTQRDLIAGEVSKDIAKRKLIPSYIIEAHQSGAIHYHDMDYAIQKGCFNCCLINLEDMLQNGTVINKKLVEPPKSFSTACTVATQIIAQIASGQFGGNTITIRHLAPFLRVSYNKYYNHYIEKGYTEEVAKDLAKDRRDDELKSGIQTIRYQISTLNTTNGQSPFCTIALIIVEGDEYEQEQADICYEMIRQRLEGMKNYKGQIIGEEFPKLVYVLDKHNCFEGGKYDYITKLAAKCNTKRLVPDYLSAKMLRQNYKGQILPPISNIVA